MAASETPPLPPADGELGLPGLVEVASGYQRAQALFAANALGVFQRLADGALTAEEMAAALGAPVRGVRSLLEACAALRMLRRTGDRYENSRTARLFLLPGEDASFAAVLRFWQRFSYGAWGRLTEAVRDDQPQTATGPKPHDLFDHLLRDDAQVRLFFDGLAGLAYWAAHKLAETVDFSGRHHLLDVGGGSGVYSSVIAARHPHLTVTLFDLEPVCALARERFARVQADGRLRTVAGDFHHDPLPGGVDCVLFSHVLHDWSPPECLALLRKAHDALAPGGEVLVLDFLPEEGQTTVAASLFSLALLLDTNRGRVYTREAVSGWLQQCCFGRIGHMAMTGGTSLVTAMKDG